MISQEINKVMIVKRATTIFIILIFLTIMMSTVALAEPHEDYDEYYDNEIEETETMTPPSRVIVVDHSVEGGGLVAGEISTVLLRLQNTSDYYGINSVLLTGWIESGAPVEFTATNQVYAGRIAPGGEIIVELMYYTQNVDLTAIASVTVGFAINYGDEATSVERVSNVSINLPVLRGLRTTVEEVDMIWEAYYPSRVNVILSSREMQIVYLGLLVVSLLLSIVLILFKVGILVRK